MELSLAVLTAVGSTLTDDSTKSSEAEGEVEVYGHST